MKDGSGFCYVFGPAFSRRLGRSLGVDVVPFKTCTYDCVYCQLGKTTDHTAERKVYVPLDDVLAEVQRKFDSGIEADYVTLAGSGEPTLYAPLGDLLRGIKAITDAPIAVLTNGSLLSDPAVRADLCEADLVMPSLDAADAETFALVNQPVAEVVFEEMVEGLVAFREAFKGKLWLEIFVLEPYTSAEEHIERFKALVDRVGADRVQLNTVTRPAPGAAVKAVSPERLERFAEILGDKAEVVAEFKTAEGAAAAVNVTPDDVLDLLRRHPCSLADICKGFALTAEDARHHVDLLIEQGHVRVDTQNGLEQFLAN